MNWASCIYICYSRGLKCWLNSETAFFYIYFCFSTFTKWLKFISILYSYLWNLPRIRCFCIKCLFSLSLCFECFTNIIIIIFVGFWKLIQRAIGNSSKYLVYYYQYCSNKMRQYFFFNVIAWWLFFFLF